MYLLDLSHEILSLRSFAITSIYMRAVDRTILLRYTRKYPLRGYILGVLTHTTALDRLWGGDEPLNMWF